MNVSNSNKHAFVFVVCGTKEHIRTLNFSLKALKKYTSNEIIVVTDSKRNEELIEHQLIIDTQTPSKFSNHQASIWLKTSLHKILPKDKVYCYLDSDVIAVSKECNDVFKHYVLPITFAKDDSTVEYFSPYAVNCNCLEKFNEETEYIKSLLKNIFNNKFEIDYSNVNFRKLTCYLQEVRNNSLLLLKLLILLPFSYFTPLRLHKDLFIDFRNKSWKINSQYTQLIPFFYMKILKRNGLKYSIIKNEFIYKKDGHSSKNSCNHLNELLKQIFNIEVPLHYNHWNGGVFLFDKNSDYFFEQWHKNTIQIFENDKFKIRDQASLLATVFQLNLQKHYTLPLEFNFIAFFYRLDIYPHFHNKNIFFCNGKTITPKFIHIFHNFGDENWDVWQRVVEILEEST